MPRPDVLDWLIVAASALGAALVLARVGAHAGLTYDSLFYVELARNVSEGEGYTNYDGWIHKLWPPGYPVLLAVASLGIIDPYDAAGPLNAVMFGLTIFAVGRYLRGRLETRFLALWACLAIALALPLAELATFAMQGTAFILFATLALIQTDRALRDDRRSALAWAAVFCAMAWQIRYIGAVVPALTGLAMLLQGGMPLSRRILRAAFLAAIVGAPMALWLRIAQGRLFTGYDANRFSLSEVLRDGAQILASWGQPLPGWLGVIVLAALIISLCAFMARGAKPCVRRACLIFGGFALAYAALLIAAIMLGTTWDGVRPRYVAVLYIPLVVVAAFALDGMFGWARARRAAAAGRLPMISAFARGSWANRLAVIALGGGLCAWIAIQAVENADYIARANSGELRMDYAGPRWGETNYAGPRWTESETLRYIRENLSGEVIYANQDRVAHFHTGENVEYRGLPTSGARVFTNDTSSPWYFLRWATTNHGAYVAWFNYDDPRKGLSVIRLRAREGLEPVAEFADGELFRLNSEYKPTPDANPWLDAYVAIESGEAARRSSGTKFDVYVHKDRLVYFKSPCVVGDTWERFFLHIFPVDAVDLPDDRKRAGFENLDFEFKRHGALFGDNCVALTPLPRYEYERISTGQYVSGEGALWKAELAGTYARRYRQAHNAATNGDYGIAAARSNFDVYLDDAESGALIYVKERCAEEDTRARFFLHVFPADAADLSADAARHGFDNMDFQFADYGANLGGMCVAMRELPEYGIERVRTGQHISGEGAVWRVEFGVGGGE